MAKIIAFDEEARRGLERGMNQLADAVKRDMGASLELIKVPGNCPLIGRPHVFYLS